MSTASMLAIGLLPSYEDNKLAIDEAVTLAEYLIDKVVTSDS